VRELFREYADGLGVDLCFQGFEAELAGLPGAYAPPSGRLLLVVCGSEVYGCVALRRLSDSAAEMKRLYVRPAARGTGLGWALVNALIVEAEAIGYRRILLDTLPTMTAAIRLYSSRTATTRCPGRDTSCWNCRAEARAPEGSLRHTSIVFHLPPANRSAKNTPRAQMSTHIATHAPNRPMS
jgi:GNAT superfamily N-acetyltransferase